MAYSELVKSFERIRNYMREFYVYGFKSRDEYGMKSARSYDNERRRIESWLGDYMSFHQESSGKKVFLSMDSRRVPCNPLYTFVRFDQYADGDPYSDPNYVHCFRMVLRAIHENRKMRIRFHGHTGVRHSFVCNPYRLEYSEKDDKFRILVTGMRRMNTINMARIRSCELLEEYDPGAVTVPKGRLKALTLLLHDERNGLERVLLHFSHFEKETQKLDERLYRITLRYDQDDETELLIRVLSFGPVLEVVAPITFRQLMRNRIQKQALYAARGFSQ